MKTDTLQEAESEEASEETEEHWIFHDFDESREDHLGIVVLGQSAGIVRSANEALT